MKHTKRTTPSMRIITKMVSCLLIIISSSVFCVVTAAAASAAVKTLSPPTPSHWYKCYTKLCLLHTLLGRFQKSVVSFGCGTVISFVLATTSKESSVYMHLMYDDY